MWLLQYRVLQTKTISTLMAAQIQTNLSQYSPIQTNTSWIDWYVLNTNGSQVPFVFCTKLLLLSYEPLWIHTYSNWYWPIQIYPNEYSVNGLVCIESVFKYVLSVFRKQYRINTYLDRYWPIQVDKNAADVDELLDCKFARRSWHVFFNYAFTANLCIHLTIIVSVTDSRRMERISRLDHT